MGACTSVSEVKQVFLCGLDGSGKTTFLYTKILQPGWKADSTMGFNYEEIREEGKKIGIWDVGGKDSTRSLWATYYRNVRMNGVIFLVDTADADRIPEARRLLHLLANEEELREAIFLIIFNRHETDEDLEEDDVEIQHNELKEKLDLHLLHNSIQKRTFYFDVRKKETEHKDAMKWFISKMDE
mmetsp:Transcript_7788/g.8480  ORF Transcript_7788/g.8480 Transcript_7788/m.8480 type:complete len:184 (-) Transcript_7788:83-634(-)